MKAVRISKVGGPEVMKYEEVPIPTLHEKEALVRIKSIGVILLISIKDPVFIRWNYLMY